MNGAGRRKSGTVRRKRERVGAARTSSARSASTGPLEAAPAALAVSAPGGAAGARGGCPSGGGLAGRETGEVRARRDDGRGLAGGETGGRRARPSAVSLRFGTAVSRAAAVEAARRTAGATVEQSAGRARPVATGLRG